MNLKNKNLSKVNDLASRNSDMPKKLIREERDKYLQADAVDDRVVALDRIIDHGFEVVLIDGHQTSSEVPSTASCRLSHPGIC